MGRLVLLVLAFFMFPALPAWACTSPDGQAGDIIYNTDFGVVQWCDGTNWYAAGGGSGSGLPTCSNGEILQHDGSAWQCAAAPAGSNAWGDLTGVPTNIDDIANLSCTDGQIISYDQTGGAWVCSSGGADTLSGLSCTAGQVAKWSGSAWACADDLSGGGGGGSASCTDPLDGLTSPATFPAGPMATLTPAGDPATFHTRIALTASADGAIIESGGSGQGLGLWITSGVLYFGVGDGSVTTSAGDAIVISTDISDYDGQTVDIVAAVDTANGQAALYINDCWATAGATTDGTALGNFSGTNDGGYGETNGTQRNGMNANALAGATLESDLSSIRGNCRVIFRIIAIRTRAILRALSLTFPMLIARLYGTTVRGRHRISLVLKLFVQTHLAEVDIRLKMPLLSGVRSWILTSMQVQALRRFGMRQPIVSTLNIKMAALSWLQQIPTGRWSSGAFGVPAPAPAPPTISAITSRRRISMWRTIC